MANHNPLQVAGARPHKELESPRQQLINYLALIQIELDQTPILYFGQEMPL